MIDPLHLSLGGLSGVLVGFALGLVGGGGSILAVPLMVYLVGVKNPHVAIGTSALAVAANAATGLFQHARAGDVRWPCGLTYAAFGVMGALAGATLGKNFDGQKLLFLFALLMLAVGTLMLRSRKAAGTPDVRLGRDNAPRLIAYGLGTGAFSGFFGIGGGFLIVPGLIASTDMMMINAVGTSLVAVTAFGLATAANYAASGLVDWVLAGGSSPAGSQAESSARGCRTSFRPAASSRPCLRCSSSPSHSTCCSRADRRFGDDPRRARRCIAALPAMARPDPLPVQPFRPQTVYPVQRLQLIA